MPARPGLPSQCLPGLSLRLRAWPPSVARYPLLIRSLPALPSSLPAGTRLLLEAPRGLCLLDRPASPYLMGGSRETDPAVIQGHDKRSSLKLHAHLASPEQDQRVYGHHAAVSDEHPTGSDLFVVHQVGAVKVSDLEQKTSDVDPGN